MSEPFSASPTAQPVDPTAANDNRQSEVETVFSVMTAMTAYFASVWSKTDELRALKHEKLMLHYGWTNETIERFRIGFDDGGVVDHLRQSGFDDREILSTGAFRVDTYNAVVSVFDGRIVFPYLDAKEVTRYFTGRETHLTRRWTDKNGHDITPKYVKTRVHGGEDDGISASVVNIIFSTHEAVRKQRIGIIAEGIADAISAAQAGFPVRSPVTTSFKESDAEIIGDLISGWDKAVLVPDMEFNRSGIQGAIKTGKKLIAQGRDVRIAVLPHEHLKRAADARVEALRLQRVNEGTTATDIEIKDASDWKADLNEYLSDPSETREVLRLLKELTSCATPEDEAIVKEARAVAVKTISSLRAERTEGLRKLVNDAGHALDVMISELPQNPTPAEFGTIVADVTQTIALIENEAEREAWLDRLKNRVGGRIPQLRKMVESATEDDGEGEEEPENLLTPILSGLKFFRILTGRVFTSVDGVAVPVDGEEFASWLANKCFMSTKKVVGPTAIKDSIRAVVGVSTKLPLGVAPIRYGYDPKGDGMWIDLADKDGNYVHITAKSVRLKKACPIAFYRPAGTCAMPIPEVDERSEVCAQAMEDWFTFLAVGKQSRAGLYAIILSAMRPMESGNGGLTTYSVGVFNGEHGSGKSTRQKFVRRLIDPREPGSMKMPDNLDDLTIYCENSAVVSLDNQSALSETMSDGMCRVATGDGAVKRSLYTSRDLAVFRGSKPILVNGITDVVTRDDLLDRSLIIHVERPDEKRTDDELEVDFTDLFPRVLGAFCTCIMDALATEAETTVDRSIRMLQAARWAAAAEITAGFDSGSVEAAYLAARAEAVAIASDDPFVTAVLAIAVYGWKGTMTELTERVIEHVEERDVMTGKPSKKTPKDFPTTTPKVRSMFKRKLPALRALGLLVTRTEERTATSSKTPLIELTMKKAEPKADDVKFTTNGINAGASHDDPLYDV